MSWLFSQALVEEYSAGTSLAGEPFAQLNAMPTPRGFWHRDKMIECSQLSRYGPTCRLLTASYGEELLTSFRAAFRAKTSAQQERAQESKAQDQDSGQKCFGLFAMFDPDSSSWKTPQCSLFEDSEKSSVTWPRWGMMQNGACWERTTWEPLTGEKGSGYWPTPCAVMSKGSSPASLTRKNGRDRSNDRLDHAVMAQDGGQLNPDWTEWLMGWPIGWTASEPLAMDKFRQWQQQHSDFCSPEF